MIDINIICVDINPDGIMSSSTRTKVPLEVTLEVRDACYCLLLQRAARAMARRYDDAMRPHGLTSGQFSLLMALNGPEATIPRVAATLGMDRTTVTANLKPLERRGLIVSGADPHDRRVRRLALTAGGHRVLLAALPTWVRIQKETDALIPASRAAHLRADLTALGGIGELLSGRAGGSAGKQMHDQRDPAENGRNGAGRRPAAARPGQARAGRAERAAQEE
jgi:DNA-binding MarR family transcriptional regulator